MKKINKLFMLSCLLFIIFIISGCGRTKTIYPLSAGAKIEGEYNTKRQRDGTRETTDSNGKIIDGGEYKNGLKEGIWIEKYMNGEGKGKYINGQREGIWIRIYDDGGKLEGEMKNNNPIGKWKITDLGAISEEEIEYDPFF